MGWLRANLYLDRLQGYPPRGSLQETALLLTYFKKQEAKLLRDVAIIQALKPDKTAIERFEDYKQAAFPFVEGGRKQEAKQLAEAIAMVENIGPLEIEPIGQERPRRRRNN